MAKENEEEKDESVQIPADQYKALLDRMAFLEGAVEEKSKKEEKKTYTVDELAAEGKRREKKESLPSAEDMQDPQKFGAYIYQAVMDNLIAPLDTKIETLRAMQELDLVSRRHDDFWLYGEEIKQMAIKNPSMSIETCYKVAKSEDPERGKKGKKGEEDDEEDVGEKLSKKDAKLYTLPKVPKVALGDKPTGSKTFVAEKAPKSRREAAERAFDELEKKQAKEKKE